MSLFSLSFALAGCNEFFRAEMSGQLVVEPGRDLFLKPTKGERVHLGTSPAVIVAQDRGYTSAARAELRVGKHTFVFKIPDRNFSNVTDFAVPAAATGQGIGLRARRTTTTVQTRIFEGPVDCELPGVCRKCGPGVDKDGHLQLILCQITESQTCPGTQAARQQEDTNEDSFVAEMIPAGASEPIARFEGRGWKMQSVKTLEVLGECKQSFR